MIKYRQNIISFIGLVLIIVFILVESVLVVIEYIEETDIFLGLLTYTVMPLILFAGIGLFIWGIWIHRFKGRKGHEIASQVTFDLTNREHLKKVIIGIILVVTLILSSFIGSYKVYHYTESNQFCGLMCHTVMHPEYTTFQNSPHARVNCTECHIGEGTGWYVKSKMSGARQIYHAIIGDYSKPINTPIENLRPAQETCEQCHWPKKFFGAIEQKRNYFSTDEQLNWNIKLLIKVGGGGIGKEGIHAHMFEDNDVYYVPSDKSRQKIPWVRVVNKSGIEKIYTGEESPYIDSLPPADLIRKMDCIDCHNRPSHQFKAPYRTINEALYFNTISVNIPDIKTQLLDLFEKEYPSQDSAIIHIRAYLLSYYKENHPDFIKNNQSTFDSTLVEVEKLYRKSIFPEMKARWDAFPDNIGHLISDGCFRCHDGKHVSSQGDVITRDCNACHLIIEQGLVSETESNTQGLNFKHPSDIDEEWKTENCTECHNGGNI